MYQHGMKTVSVDPDEVDALDEVEISEALREAVDREMDYLEDRGLKQVRMRCRRGSDEVYQVTINAGDEMYRLSEVSSGNVSRTVFRNPERKGDENLVGAPSEVEEETEEQEVGEELEEEGGEKGESQEDGDAGDGDEEGSESGEPESEEQEGEDGESEDPAEGGTGDGDDEDYEVEEEAEESEDEGGEDDGDGGEEGEAEDEEEDGVDESG